MNDESPSSTTTATTQAAEPIPNTAPESGEFRFDVLLIAIVIVSAIIASNIWLRRRAERADSD